eukprot:8514432-Prorocentrum_lima.AAC.1
MKTRPGCLALRGYLVVVVGSQPTRPLHPGGHCYVLDFVSKKFNMVARSSFAAELRHQLGSTIRNLL